MSSSFYRVCSLLPSATTMMFELGFEDRLVGVTHECDQPPEAQLKDKIVRCKFDPAALASDAIDSAVSSSLKANESLYIIDTDKIKQLQPDLVLTQDLCSVCSLAIAQIDEINAALGRPVRTFVSSPHDIGSMLADLCALADLLGEHDRGMAARDRLTSRLARVKERVSGAERPRVVCVEWLDPVYNAGHWVPEMVDAAGGTEHLAAPREYSVRMTWDQIASSEPHVLVLMPCGFDVARAEREFHALLTQHPPLPGIDALRSTPALRTGRVWAVWAHKYFSGASPNLVGGVEMLAAILHPQLFPEILPLQPTDAKQLTLP